MFILVKYYMTKKRYCRNSSGASYLVVISAVSACSPILFEKSSFTCILKTIPFSNCHILTTKIMINIEIPSSPPIILRFFSYILTVGSDLQTKFAANRSNFIASRASIRLSFLLWCKCQSEFLRTIPIRELVGTAVGATK